MSAEFKPFPKMPRLSREMIVTEKLDGTNAAVHIVMLDGFLGVDGNAVWEGDGVAVYAQSRTRFITPEDDNFGFAAWVRTHAEELAAGLGEGLHFGEWWGQGIQRNYGLQERRFSLFNTSRWGDETVRPACCHVVPVLWTGMFDTDRIQTVLDDLAYTGSAAAPGYMKPEGIVAFHVAGNFGFKKTIEKDSEPKGKAA